MKSTLLLAALLGSLFFISCNKNNNTPASSSLPKTYTEDVRSSVLNSLTVYNLSYDTKGRLTSLAAIPEPSVVKFIYQYTAANSLTMDLYTSNTWNVHEILWLNASSSLDSTFQYNNTNDTTTEKYLYNSAMQLMHVKNYFYHYTGAVLDHTTDYTYDNSGNPTTESDNLGNSTSYTYYTNLLNNFSMGKLFFPQPKYFIKTATISSGGSVMTTTHFYSFDNSNRLVKDSASTSGSVDVISIKSYTY